MQIPHRLYVAAGGCVRFGSYDLFYQYIRKLEEEEALDELRRRWASYEESIAALCIPTKLLLSGLCWCTLTEPVWLLGLLLH